MIAHQQKGHQRKFLIGFQYFIQGLTWNLPSTLIYTYEKVPSYFILSIFQISRSIAAIKCLISPFVQTYNSLTYGRRKTWIIVGLIGMMITCILTSFFSTYQFVLFAALLSLPHMFFNATEDVALDALVLKEISDPGEISWIQTVWNRGGRRLGSFLFVKFVSNSFGHKIGLESSIMSTSTFYLIVVLMILCLATYFHFSYQEPTLPSEIEFSRNNAGFCNTLKYFKVFFDTTRKECRISIFWIIFSQGLLFYSKTYKFELMRLGHSKQTINQFQNYSILPIMFLVYFYSKLAKDNIWLHVKIIAFARFIFYLSGYLFKPTSFYPLLLYVTLDNILQLFKYLVDTMVVNSFPVTEFTAMTVSTLNSAWTIGESSFVHMWIIGWIGHKTACMVGFIVQLVILIGIGRLIEWVLEGKVDESIQPLEDDQLR